MKINARERLNAAVATTLPTDQHDLFRRWINCSASEVVIDGKAANPTRYVENAAMFEGLGDEEADPAAEVVEFFAAQHEIIAARFAAIEQERKDAADAQRRAKEELSRRQEEARQAILKREREDRIATARAVRECAAEAETLVPPSVVAAPESVEPISREVEREFPHAERRETNASALTDRIAKRLKYVDGAALRADAPDLYETVKRVVVTYKWGKDGVLAVERDLADDAEMGKTANSIYKFVVEPKLGDREKTAAAKRGEDREASTTLAWDAKMLGRSVAHHLMSREGQNHTYNQIANDLGAPWKEVSAACRALARNPDAGVLEFEVKVKAKSGAETGHKVYQYAPERREIDADPGKTDEVVERVLVRLIGHTPAQSWTALRAGVRGVLVKIDDRIVDRCRVALIERGKVALKDGPRGAKMHYLAH